MFTASTMTGRNWKGEIKLQEWPGQEIATCILTILFVPLLKGLEKLLCG